MRTAIREAFSMSHAIKLPTDDSPWGTTIFDGRAARRGYALNKMCFSFNDAANRERIPARRGGVLPQLRSR